MPSPTLEGPVTGGDGKPSIGTTTFDLAQVGYMQEEFFISGTATAYTSADPLTADGNWTVTPASTAPYKTRILVYRPMRSARFNGTVVVEWLNVSAGADVAADWINAHTELIRDGFAWVGVSAQAVGVEGGTSAWACRARDQECGPGAVRVARPSRRQLLVRHLLAGRAGDSRSRRARARSAI